MKTILIVLGTMGLAVVLVAAGVWLASGLFHTRWGAGARDWGAMGPWMMGSDESPDGATCSAGSAGSGIMGGWGSTACGQNDTAPSGGTTISLEQAKAAVERDLDQQGYSGLHVTEVMEFQRNFYVIVAEDKTNIGAMELLVDKSSGAVGPEPGPNMMWNAKYGMHRNGMMRWSASGEMALSPQEAEKAAQNWLDANLPGRTAGDADPFYGYYTFHFLQGGDVEGMLSVNGGTGQVWYHSWHGDFVQMTEEEQS
jgi:hypothetical protein